MRRRAPQVGGCNGLVRKLALSGLCGKAICRMKICLSARKDENPLDEIASKYRLGVHGGFYCANVRTRFQESVFF